MACSDLQRKSVTARFLTLIALLLFAPAALADGPAWQVCFTPGEACTDVVVTAIAGAQHQVLVQAYSFTSIPILAALKAAHARGSDVEVIVDKSSARQAKSGSLQRRYLSHQYRHTCVGRYQGGHCTQQSHDYRRDERHNWQLQLHRCGAEPQRRDVRRQRS
jgi:phosphatidylserine/phosphatidylglycerophosphate/cardiolipin synthase-like enzyme